MRSATHYLDRFFALLDGDEPGTVASKLRAYQIVLALVIGTEYWVKALRYWASLETADFVALALVTLLSGAAVVGRRRRWVFAGFAALQLWYVWANFPHTGNHRYLELIFATLFAFLDDEVEQERLLLLRSLRFMVLVVLFYSGLHKLVHGYYFGGQYLAYSLWRDSFRTALEPLLSVSEFARLVIFDGVPGDGPYLVSGLPFRLVSNAIWIAQIGLAITLFAKATRRFAWIATIALVIGTEIVAREFMFGVEFAAAVLLFARNDLVRPFVIPVAVFLAMLILSALGILPEVLFH